jgi:DnaJ-class molecular chaperone
MLTTCGFCGGRGRVANHQADRYGPRPDYPAERPCEYCGGTGTCEDGHKLAPQGRVYQADDEDRRMAGLPPWA